MKKWNILDKFIATIRYSKVKKFIKKDSIIVDIGCGREGKFLLAHKNIIKKGYGFDFRIKNHTIDNVEFINNRNIKSFPIDKQSVDAVFLLAVLEHLEKPEEILLEALKMLKINGNIVLTVPTPKAKPILEFMAFKLHIINEDEIKEHKDYFDKNKIEKLITKLNKKNTVELTYYKRFEFGVNSLIVITKK